MRSQWCDTNNDEVEAMERDEISCVFAVIIIQLTRKLSNNIHSFAFSTNWWKDNIEIKAHNCV